MRILKNCCRGVRLKRASLCRKRNFILWTGASLKKSLVANDGEVCTADGEVIEGLKFEQPEDKFCVVASDEEI